MPIVTLITDFGIGGPYLAMVKGAMLKINPSINFIDIANEINIGDILCASFLTPV
jgi:S-adenosylmethionine hydrolase